ncbi:MAG: ATP-binding protein [Proteobacteria bacterium]|nr:ATP-binding protein [Pseudomonadota bacterium]
MENKDTRTDYELPGAVSPFESHVSMMHAYGEVFVILCLRYMGLHGERIVNDAGGYGPQSVALAELFEAVTGQRSQQSLEWMQGHRVPPPEACRLAAQARLEHIRHCCERTFEAHEAGKLENFPKDADPVPVETLQNNFGLTTLEVFVILSCALIQFDERYARAWHYVTGANADAHPTAGFLTELLRDFARDDRELVSCFMQTSALRRYALVEIASAPGRNDSEPPVSSAQVSVPNRIVSLLIGNQAVCVPESCRMLERSSAEALASAKTAENAIFRQMQKKSMRLAVLGYRGIGRRDAVCQAAGRLGVPVMLLSLDELCDRLMQDRQTERYFASILREIRISHAVLLVDAEALQSEHETWLLRHAHKIRMVFEKEAHLSLAVLLERQNSLSREVFGELSEIAIPAPSRAEQPKLWRAALSRLLDGETAQSVSEMMAGGYCLSYAEIISAIDRTRARFPFDAPARALTAENLSDTLNKTRGQKLEGLASLRSTSLYLKDIVLSEDIRKVLNEIINYAKYSETVMRDWGFAKYNTSGAGLSVLLSGVPGTGKTLTALVLAHELGRALYVVDLSRVVDKYIGETEKKLAQIFDEAERSQAMLLFDEADSLFAKRTDVKSSNDRYANLEVNYLLQRLEAYRGVSILTTNFGGGLDEALARRIQFKIDFPMPDAAQRTLLWQKLIPPGAPCASDIDFGAIAEHFEMSGGHIKNAVFRASIQALSENAEISHAMLWEAAAHEYRSMGHIMRDDSEDERLV